MCGSLDTNLILEVQPETDLENIIPVGSWTNFMKCVNEGNTSKSKLEYLPVIPLPHQDNVIKWYMDMALKMIEQLECEFIYIHADEAILSKVLMIQWLSQGKYDKIITFLGGFHTILVNLRVIWKKYACLGLKEWWVEANVIAEGSADRAAEGKNYHRGMRLHKQGMEALLRYRILRILSSSSFSLEFKQKSIKLRLVPTKSNFESLLVSDDFKKLLSLVTEVSGTQC